MDIGANLGAYSIPIAKDIQEKGGKVIAFEPQRIVFYQLCANVFINRLDNYYPVNKAVSDCPGYIEIPEFDYALNKNVGAFSLENAFRESTVIESSIEDKRFQVEVINLDQFEVDRSPALIKIDVEGFEINVLRGSSCFLETHNYPPFLFEAWNSEWFSEGKRDLLSFFETIGYSLFKIDPTNFVAQHPKNPVAIDFSIENNIIHMNRIR